MPDRYEFTFQARDEDRRFRKYNSTLYPKIELDDSDIYIQSVDGDRLDLLASQYYDDVNLWWVIAQANHIGKGTMNILPGTQLRIPQNLSQLFSDLETINRTR
jgi:hypothetical protein